MHDWPIDVVRNWTIEITVENEEQVQALLGVIEEALDDLDFALNVRIDRHET